jgi:hypothetical protein
MCDPRLGADLLSRCAACALHDAVQHVTNFDGADRVGAMNALREFSGMGWRNKSLTRQAYEEKAFAMYFAYEIPFPYIGVTLMALTCAWLMYGHVPTHYIVIWFFVGGRCPCCARCLFGA